MHKLPNDNQCYGCLACKDACNKNAISIRITDGHIYPSVNTDLCINCGLCEKVCPAINPINHNFSETQKVYGGWCKDEKLRKCSASGGAFSAMALHVLRQSGCAIGASLEDNGFVKHIAVDKSEDLPLLQKSKYIQSDASESYRTTKKLLTEGKTVIFSGTPCQVAALNSYLGKQYETLITVDLVCNGVPSRDALDFFVRKSGVDHIVSYRGKDFGWHDIFSQGITWCDSDGKIHHPKCSRDLFYKIFACGLTHRQSCCNCKFCSMPRYSDITIADFWGIKRFKEEWQDGISLIIANSEKGDKFVNKCCELHLFESDLNECILANPRLVNGIKYQGWHPIMRYRQTVRSLLGEKTYLSIIENRYPWRLLWGILKVLTIISNKRAIKRLKV